MLKVVVWIIETVSILLIYLEIAFFTRVLS